MRMYVLNLGSMFLDENFMVANINAATRKNPHAPNNWGEIPVQACLVDTGDGYVLYDTGNHEPRVAPPADADVGVAFVYKPEQLLPERLKQLRIDPAEVKTVVVSHLHSDHAGYLYLFKNAEIIVSDYEFSEVMKRYGQRKLTGPYMYRDIDAFLEARLDNWRLIPADVREYKVCDGITVLHLGPGHTYGMLGMMVELPKSGNYLLCADALYRPENLRPPIRMPTLLVDSINYIKSVEFIAQYAKDHNAQILFGHDIRQFFALTHSDKGFYE